MSNDQTRFAEREPMAIAGEDDDLEALMSDEDPEPDPVWQFVDEAAA
jgi:hypothetical protein